MAAFHVRLGRDSQDFDLHATGSVDAGMTKEILFAPEMCKEPPATAKVQAIFYAIESGLKIFLYWENEDEDAEHLLVPLEGRGLLILDRFGGLENPRHPGHTGKIILVAWNEAEEIRHFALSLELTKQRS